jgi:lipopolysaccharide export system protein LptA
LRRRLTALLLLSPAMLVAQESDSVAPAREKLPAISMLPDGSQLHGVMLPRYDENRKLSGVLKAASMTLVNEEQMAGESVSVEFFNPDQSPRGRIDLKKAIFHQTRGILEAREPVEIKADRLTARGSGLYYSFQQAEGFLLGPATTTIHAFTETTMHTPRTPLRAATLLGMSLLTQSLVAAPPPAMTAGEKAAVQADAVSKSPAAAAANATTRTQLESALAAAETAGSAAKTFLVQADIPVTPADPGTAAKPLDVKPGPDDTVIACDGGMYFDADEGVLVYLKNVTVKDPRFDLSGAGELKIFFAKKPAETPQKPATEKSKGAFGNVGANFGEVERIVATGAVLIKQISTQDKKPAIEASGAVFTYNVKTGEIILSGGYPWVKQGSTYLRAREPNLNLRIQKSGSFATEGNWDMGGNLNQKN